MSDTQRTDALFNTSMYADDKLEAWATLARKLETELAASEARVKQLEQRLRIEGNCASAQEKAAITAESRIATLEARLARVTGAAQTLLDGTSGMVPLAEWAKRMSALRAALAEQPEDVRITSQVIGNTRVVKLTGDKPLFKPDDGRVLVDQSVVKDAERYRYVRNHVSRIFNEETLMLDGLRVEMVYDEPQPFLLSGVKTDELFDAAIDAAREGKP